MKYILKTVALFAAALSLAACGRECAGLFGGSYSFKTSGTVTADLKADFTRADGTAVQLDTTGMEIALVTEQGQMNILKDSRDAVVVTMNVLGGDVKVFNAYADGDVLTVEPFRTRVKLNVGRIGQLEIPVTVSGTAERLGDVVIWELEYEGDAKTVLPDGSAEIGISDSEVKCVAREND